MFYSRCQELEAENAALRAGNSLPIPVPSSIYSKDSQEMIDHLTSELEIANRRASLLESDLARLRSAQAEMRRQQMELASKGGMESPVEEVSGPKVSSAGDGDIDMEAGTKKSKLGQIQNDVMPKNMMMALLMLLSPILAHDARETKADGQSTTQTGSIPILPSPRQRAQ